MAAEQTAVGSVAGHSPLRGMVAMLTAVTIFSGVDALAKWFGHEGFHPAQILFFRYTIGMIPVIALVVWSGLDVLQTRKLGLQALRAILMVISLGMFFWGLARVPLAEGIAVGFTAPLFIVALGHVILGERVGLRRAAAVAAGFVGALIILRPASAAFQPASLVILASAFIFAFAILATRRLTATESNTSVFAYTTFIALVFVTPFAWMTWQPPGAHHLPLFAAIGVFGSLAHFLIIIAYRNAPVAVIAPLEYVALVLGAVWGWLIWSERADWPVWVGAAIIIGSSLYITHRERQAAAAP